MAEGCQKNNWEHTAAVLAMLANVNRDTKKRPKPFSPNEFNPCIPRRKPPGDPEGLAALRAGFERLGKGKQ